MAENKEQKEEKDPIIVEESDDEVVPSSDEIDSSKEDEKEKIKQKTKPVKKRGSDNQKRINELWMARKEAEENAQRNANIAASERAKNQEYEKITASALEENISTKRDLLSERMQRAVEAGDNKKISDLTVELGKIEAQAAQIERYKIENQINPAQQQQQQVSRQQQAPEQVSGDELYERLSPSGKKWMDENNDWYAEDSENHDPEKFSDVTYYAQKLERELASQGRASEVGTKAYFKKIDDYIKENWDDNVSDEQSDDEEQEKPIKKSYAAPVGNRSVNEKPNGGRKEYKITQQEKEMALSLSIKGKGNQEVSDAEKIKRFVALREGTPSSGPISMKTIRK